MLTCSFAFVLFGSWGGHGWEGSIKHVRGRRGGGLGRGHCWVDVSFRVVLSRVVSIELLKKE